MILSAMQAPVKPEVVIPEQETVIRARCDQCGFQPFVKATRNDKELLFCLHHGQANVSRLIADGWIIEDNTALINTTVKAILKTGTSPDAKPVDPDNDVVN